MAKSVLITALCSALALGEQVEEFTEDKVLPQMYSPDKRLQMLLKSYAKYNSHLDFDEFQKTQPVVGILTTPIFMDWMKTSTFDYPHFTWDTNVHFVHYAGSWAVPVRYDLDDENLEKLLDSINGIFFAGGATELIDMETGEMSDFYKTTKKIWNYMKRQKDEKGIDWPIFGICQGFEIIHYLANEDAKDTLSNVVIYESSRAINYTKPDIKNSGYTMFDVFPDQIIEAMGNEPLLYHAHDYVIATETYNKRSQLSDFFEILATDTYMGKEFVIAVEGKRYPVTGTMLHPETANRHIVSTTGVVDSSIAGKVNNMKTDAINFYFSKHLNERASKTLATHKFDDPSFGLRMSWLNTNTGFTNWGNGSNLVSYGF